jgi:hypothetical protein
MMTAVMFVIGVILLAEFRAPPPIPKFIDASEAIDELPSYDSFEPAPDDFQNPLPH